MFTLLRPYQAEVYYAVLDSVSRQRGEHGAADGNGADREAAGGVQYATGIMNDEYERTNREMDASRLRRDASPYC